MSRAVGFFLALIVFGLVFLLSSSSIPTATFADPDSPPGSIPGTPDDPFAASRFRFEMLGGSQPGVDLRAMRREAIAQAASLVSHSLKKSNAVSWTPLGPGNIGGRIRSIVIHPTTPLNMLLGGIAGGVWKSTDGGASWTPKSDNNNPIAIGCLLIDPTNSNVVYAGTGEGWNNQDASYGGGILKSTDFGETWSFLSSTIGANVLSFTNVLKMAADPKGNAYAITVADKWPGGFSTNDGGLYRSTDHGSTWTKISGTVANASTPCDIICVDTTKIVFATNGGGVFVSTNTGASWITASGLPVSGMGRIALAQTPASTSILYACVADPTSNLSGIYRSTNGGVNWTLAQSTISDNSTSGNNILGGQGWYDNVNA
ncbi:MAG: hypothetical protein WCK00_18375, partial [Deltaproteobacteria bacterium]